MSVLDYLDIVPDTPVPAADATITTILSFLQRAVYGDNVIKAICQALSNCAAGIYDLKHLTGLSVEYIKKSVYTNGGELIADLTKDGKVSNTDVIKLSRIVEGIDTADDDAGDINFDGVIGADDLTALMTMLTQKPDDWNIIRLEMHFTDGTERTVYMYEKFEFVTEDDIREVLNAAIPDEPTAALLSATPTSATDDTEVT